VAPLDENHDPVDDVRVIEKELADYSEELAKYDRWLVLNKLDLMLEEEQEERCQAVIQALDWQGPVFTISAMKQDGTRELCFKIMEFIEEKKRGLLDEDSGEEEHE